MKPQIVYDPLPSEAEELRARNRRLGLLALAVALLLALGTVAYVAWSGDAVATGPLHSALVVSHMEEYG
jgi:hypothetical protein